MISAAQMAQMGQLLEEAQYGRCVSKNLFIARLRMNAEIPRGIDVFFVDEHELRGNGYC
jgi:hypothetical protein